jgi:hypothetical protein
MALYLWTRLCVGYLVLILLSVVYRDVTRQANGLYRLKHAGAH